MPLRGANRLCLINRVINLKKPIKPNINRTYKVRTYKVKDSRAQLCIKII